MAERKSGLIQPVYPQLRFGVELSTLYPEWYLHPALKNLMYEALVNTKRRNVATLHEVLEHASEYQGSLEERLYFKDRLIIGKNIIGFKTSPGVHLWVLRHFLGLLPTPLILTEENRPNFWLNISMQCKDILILLARKSAASHHLEEMIATELTRLPARNLTLIFELFELFRDLSAKTFQKSLVDKPAIMALVRFFTPCMFKRPYRPGVITNNDKRFFPLVLFTIIYWKNIKNNCQDLLTNMSKEETLYKFFYLPDIPEEDQDTDNLEKNSFTDKDDAFSCSSFEFIQTEKQNEDTKYLADNFTQTSDQEDKEKEQKEKPVTSTPLKEVQTIVNKPKSNRIKNKDQSEDLILRSSSCKLTKSKEGTCESINLIKFNSSTSNNNITNKNNIVHQYSEHDLLDLSEDYAKDKNNKEQNKRSKTAVVNKSTKEKQNKIEIQKQDISETEINPYIKVSKIKKRFQKNPQVIVLQINPCNCTDRKKKTNGKSKKTKATLQQPLDAMTTTEKHQHTMDENSKGNNKQVFNNQLTLLDTPNFCCNYSKNIYSEFGNLSISNGWNQAGCSKETDDGYIFDSYVGSLQEEHYKPTDISTIFKPFDSTEVTPKNNELMDKIAKIGWTYENKSGTSTPKKITEPTDVYHLYFDTESKKLEEMKKEPKDSGKNLVTSKRDSSILNNLKKVGSKLNIFKTFSTKHLAKKTISYENLISDLKSKTLVRNSNSL